MFSVGPSTKDRKFAYGLLILPGSKSQLDGELPGCILRNMPGHYFICRGHTHTCTGNPR